ncbi:MAG: helix-turn-helix domain-containing protein [Chloroflexota bacterium]|nr:helix-turn-helix domain-containing protein [Chloroflexota bacterium]
MGAGTRDEIVGDSSGDRGRYLSAKEAADLLGVNRATVINWARQGKFGGFQYGQRGIYRFERQEILEFIDRSRIPLPLESDASGEREAAL